ncbi:MAG: chromate efflux transporter [Pseudomonadota bacterium]
MSGDIIERHELIRVFGRIGLLSFGGPAAQIALMHRELVEERPWLTERQFLGALSFCMLLPGPEAMQLATYAGWRKAGLRGGLLAGLLFVLPGAAVILALASLYVAYGQLPLVTAAFLGVKAAVVIIVIQALIKVAGKALKSPLAYAIAAAAFVAIFVFDLAFPLVILAAALIGAFVLSEPSEAIPEPPQTSPAATLSLACTWAAIWLAPLALLWLLAPDSLLADLGLFFAKLAVVTFGGAYAVLAYMVQAVVGDFGWLTTGQMMDALGLAETTPGPLILVTEFVGFVAGAQAGGWGLGLAAAAVTLWVTFAPCFLWIFVGAPYVEWISAQPRLTGALSAITAAIVGVILNLSLWFALNVAFGEVTRITAGPVALWMPVWPSIEPGAFVLSTLAAILLLHRKMDLVQVLAIMAVAGIVWQLATGPLFG